VFPAICRPTVRVGHHVHSADQPPTRDAATTQQDRIG
jgi:hypothetical protein